jgi:uncharacterized protein YuzE
MKKRLLSIALAVMLIASLIPAAVAMNFTDVTETNMRRAVEMLNNLEVISNAERFNPSGALTRAQFCAMAVPLSGIYDVTPYKTYTIFPDVRSNHWAMGYINAAVRELKLFAPLPNGTFAPDRPITYYEAVTILVRMLGYTEADVGFNWPRSFTARANSIGLTNGVARTETLNRGQGALLFYNLLFTQVKGDRDAPLFIESVFGARRETDVIITQVNTYSNGRLGIRTAEGAFYPTRRDMDISLEGCRVDLLLDKSGHVLAAERHNQNFGIITVSAAHRRYIVDTLEREYDVNGNTLVLFYDGRALIYDDVWESVNRNDTLRIAYTPRGDIDYMVWEQSDLIRVNNVIILEIDAVNDEGILGVRIDGASSNFYPSRVSMDRELIGRRVNLTLNRRDQVIRVEPLEQNAVTLTVTVVSSTGISAANGANLLIPGDTTAFANGRATTYSDMFRDISIGDILRVFYRRNGTVDYVVWNSGNFVGSIANLSINYPGGNAVTSLSIGGRTLRLTSEATLQAARFRAGDRVTLGVSSTGLVYSVNSAPGSVTSGTIAASAPTAFVLSNGLTLTVTQPNPPASPILGTVNVYVDESGKIIIV